MQSWRRESGGGFIDQTINGKTLKNVNNETLKGGRLTADKRRLFLNSEADLRTKDGDDTTLRFERRLQTLRKLLPHSRSLGYATTR